MVEVFVRVNAAMTKMHVYCKVSLENVQLVSQPNRLPGIYAICDCEAVNSADLPGCLMGLAGKPWVWTILWSWLTIGSRFGSKVK